jgi:hypothetical protein
MRIACMAGRACSGAALLARGERALHVNIVGHVDMSLPTFGPVKMKQS